jgi:hypothetical protein
MQQLYFLAKYKLLKRFSTNDNFTVWRNTSWDKDIQVKMFTATNQGKCIIFKRNLSARHKKRFTDSTNDHLHRFTLIFIPSIGYADYVPPNRYRLYGRRCSLAMFNISDTNIAVINVRRNDRILGLSISRRSIRNYPPHGPGVQGHRYPNCTRTAQITWN